MTWLWLMPANHCDYGKISCLVSSLWFLIMIIFDSKKFSTVAKRARLLWKCNDIVCTVSHCLVWCDIHTLMDQSVLRLRLVIAMAMYLLPYILSGVKSCQPLGQAWITDIQDWLIVYTWNLSLVDFLFKFKPTNILVIYLTHGRFEYNHYANFMDGFADSELF